MAPYEAQELLGEYSDEMSVSKSRKVSIYGVCSKN